MNKYESPFLKVVDFAAINIVMTSGAVSEETEAPCSPDFGAGCFSEVA